MNRISSTCFQTALSATLSRTLVGTNSTGKEKDSESGYHYFGARYYDSEALTGWLSVDPMSDKYPSLSPYTYCAWNPVKLVDPDGMEFLRHTPDIHKINVATGDVQTVASKNNSLVITGNGIEQSVEFPDGDFSVSFEYYSYNGQSSCSISATGGTEYNNKTFSQNYSSLGSVTLKQPKTIDGIVIPESMEFKAKPWSIGISATAIFDKGITLSFGKYYDGMGNGSWYFTFGCGGGFNAGIGLSYTDFPDGSSPKDNSGFDISSNFGISIGNGGFNAVSKSWSAGFSFGLPAGASLSATTTLMW